MVKPGVARFILASLVVLYHVSRFAFLGRFAVCSFFILSGYWITLMFSNKYLKKSQPIAVFYTSRLWRLLPVFYTFSIIGIIVWVLTDHTIISQIISQDLYDRTVFWVSNITLFGYYSFPKIDILTPAWSLDIELQFYLLFPVLFYITRNNKKLLTWLFFLMIAVSFYLCTGYDSFWVKNSLPTYLCFFILGMIMYLRKMQFSAKAEKICLVILITVIVLQYVLPYSKLHYKDIGSLYYITLSFVLVLLAVPTLANSVRIHSDKRDKFWGEFSFLVYLAHWVMIRPYWMLKEHATDTIQALYLVLYLLFTLGLALAIYWLVDRPMERLRHRWINKQS